MSVGRDGASDAVSFLRAGVPAVEFGPVGAGHHGPEEWVSVDARWRATGTPWPISPTACAPACARSTMGRPLEADDETREPDEHGGRAGTSPATAPTRASTRPRRPPPMPGRQRAEQPEAEGDQGGEGEPERRRARRRLRPRSSTRSSATSTRSSPDWPSPRPPTSAEAEPGGDAARRGRAETAELEDEDLDPADDELEADDLDDDGHDVAEELGSTEPEPPSHETVEAETLADKAEAEEAALAGLRARAAKKPGARRAAAWPSRSRRSGGRCDRRRRRGGRASRRGEASGPVRRLGDDRRLGRRGDLDQPARST